MSRFIRKHRSQLGRVSVVTLTIAGLVLAGGLAVMFVGTADAAELTNRSVTVGDSLHAQNTDYVFTFTTQTLLVHDDTAATDDYSFKFSFPTDAGGDPFAIPGGLAIGDFTVTCTSCDGITVTPRTVILNSEGGAGADDSILLVVDTGTADADVNTPIGAVFTVTIGTGATQITSPADNAAGCVVGGGVNDADVCSITIDTTETFVNPITSVDVGDVLAAYISDTTVSVTVEENLTFNITGATEVDCETQFADYGAGRYIDPVADPFNLDFGNISTFDAFYNTCQDLAVVTNAGNGYTVTIEEDTSLQTGAGVELPDTDCDGGPACTAIPGAARTWATNTNNGFGYSCFTQLDDDAGNICDIAVQGDTETTDYLQIPCTGIAADCDPGAGGAGPEILFSDSNTADDSVLIEFKLSIAGTQSAGVYSTQITYVATRIFFFWGRPPRRAPDTPYAAVRI